MSLRDALAQSRPPEIVRAKEVVPKGWEPSLTWNGADGEVCTGPVTVEPDDAVWRHLIADWGLDPETTEILPESIKLKGWDSPVRGTKTGEKIRLLSYSVRIRRRKTARDSADIAALCKLAAGRKPPRKQPVGAEDAERAMIVAMADWQLGKGEGDGTEGTVNRITAAADRLIARLRELARIGRPVHVVYLVGLGDLVEGCSNHYAMQTWSADLTRREQLMVGRRLILQLVDRLVDHGVRVVLTGVAGNHGENRQGGKAFTDWEDNDDLAVIEQVGDILAANPERYHNVSTYLPKMLSMTIDACGTLIGFAHGHQVRGSGHAAAKVEAWWSGQIVGNQPTAPADILVTGHLHHLVVSEALGRTVIQCPAMDPGSRWWTETSGASSPAGMLTFCAGAPYGRRKFGDLMVL